MTKFGIRVLLLAGFYFTTGRQAASQDAANASASEPQQQAQTQSQDQSQAQAQTQNQSQGQTQSQQPEESKPQPSETPQKPDEPKPKTSIERETGTVNERIFEVMPNYGTVRNNNELPPMTTGQKYRIATAQVFDYFAFPFNAALAGIDQANNSPKAWGQGWGAYGKRFGATFADNSIGTYMTTAIFPSMLKEDPRYYRKAEGSTKSRIWYPISRLFVTRTDDGGTRFNNSEIEGNAIAAGLSNFYHAREDRTVGRNFSTLGMLIMWDGLSNELKEFWPDVRRKFKHKKAAE